MHNKKTCRAAVAGAMATFLVLSAAARAEGLILHRGDLVVTSGDSITYMSHYSRLVEIYLLVTRPELELRVMKCQRGCGGSAGEFVANTLEEELVGLKPKVHTVCFGMNDGGRGQPWREATGEAYARALRRIVERNRQNGTLTLVASPGVVDGLSYTVGPGTGADGYNRTLANLTAIAKKVAEETGSPFADIHDPMMRMMKGAEADYGVRFPRTQLDDGVNLAEEFPENPFSGLIARVDQAVLDKQVYEREMYDCYLNVGMLRGDLRQPPAQKDAAEFFKTMDRFIQRYLPNDAKVRTIYVTLARANVGAA